MGAGGGALVKLPLDKDGAYDGIPELLYHSQGLCTGLSVNSGAARRWRTTGAARWIHELRQPKRLSSDDSYIKDRGILLHCALLEGVEALPTRFAVRPAQWRNWQPREAREWRRQMHAAGLYVVTPELWAEAAAMWEAVLAHPDARVLLQGGRREVTLVAQYHGLWLKARLDLWYPERRVIVDLKSSTNAHPSAFERAIDKFGYAYQAAFYRKVARRIEGVPSPSKWVFIVVEPHPPYLVAVYELRHEDMDLFDPRIDDDLRSIADCHKRNDWPGLPKTQVGLPPMARYRLLEQAEKDGDW